MLPSLARGHGDAGPPHGRRRRWVCGRYTAGRILHHLKDCDSLASVRAKCMELDIQIRLSGAPARGCEVVATDRATT